MRLVTVLQHHILVETDGVRVVIAVREGALIACENEQVVKLLRAMSRSKNILRDSHVIMHLQLSGNLAELLM